METSSAFRLGIVSAETTFYKLNRAADASRHGAIAGDLYALAKFSVLSDQAFEAFLRFEALKLLARDMRS